MGLAELDVVPHATGAAAKTVARHQEPQELILHAAWFCPFAHRVWITLEEKGVPYQYKEVNPYKKEPHFLAINPKGLVPVIEYKGKALSESLILVEFVEDAFPQAPNLLPRDPVERAEARRWIDSINKQFIYPHQRLLQAQSVEDQRAALDDVYRFLRNFSESIQGPYFLGEQFSLVDIVIAPWIIRDWVVTQHRGYRREDASPKWKVYADLVQKRESVANTLSLQEHTIGIYDQYLRDEAESEAARAVREGRTIP
ncbi:hypothetical protein NLJ89_g2646 [Agrocybe chaxingu]|uniref:Uncharacterized protein n=1 Tax=Agrocybe chaxingu TaxID=84603 RepID=A0A9W8MXZ2_9AGAR|nr:hypothetical protein NLJ89_g2646 [Agrocybe chaxingu]